MIYILKNDYYFIKNKMATKFEYAKYFPFDTIRNSQRKSIEFILDQFINNDKKFVILEAGTGVGKSAIGVCVSRYMKNYNKDLYKMSQVNECDNDYVNKSYILTTQKILQQQYVQDYSSNNSSVPDIEDIIVSIQSSNNFNCMNNPSMTCGEVMKQNKREGENCKLESCDKKCIYKSTKKDFLKSDGVTNFPYFLAQVTYNSHEFVPRKLLIIDEAHNCDTELCKFIEILIEDESLKRYNIVMPIHLEEKQDLVKWVQKIYLPTLKKLSKDSKDSKNSLQMTKVSKSRLTTISEELDELDTTIDKLDKFIDNYHEDNWILNKNEFDGNLMNFGFKPIKIDKYADNLLLKYGERVLLMSATIIDHKRFCKLNGISIKNSAYLEIPSPFPIENKPIIFYPVGNMTKSKINETLPKLVKRINKLLKKHIKDKGIIHCHSYHIGKFIKNNCKYPNRLLLHHSKNRDKMLDKHGKSTKNTVLLSPSMSEGVDLKDDSSRFQIICKIPYPYLGDELVMRKRNLWPWWYSYETTKKIIQSLGRSIRNETDFATTYILDEGWWSFYCENKKIFPNDFEKQFVKRN